MTVAESIIREVLTRLGNITKANGYSFDSRVKYIERDANTYDPVVGSIWVDQPTEEQNLELMCPGVPAGIAYNMTLAISGYSRRLDENGKQIDTVAFSISEQEMAGAIKKALVNDDFAGWQTFGGNAMNAIIAAGETFDAPGFDGSQVGLVVTYRISETDPAVRR